MANQAARTAPAAWRRCCLETIADGKLQHALLSFGDRIVIEMNDTSGQSIFGRIWDQRINSTTPRLIRHLYRAPGIATRR